MSKRQYAGRVYQGRDDQGKQQFHWLGYFDRKRDRDDAVARARIERPWEKPADISCNELAERYLARYAEQNKQSSLSTAANSLKPFRERFGTQPARSISHVDAEDWARTQPRSLMPQVVALFNYAKRKRIVEHNPFDGLGGKRGRGRADSAPPTPKQLEQLLDACDVLGAYGPQMRALITFAAYTGMRPGELYELRWPDIDLARNRITVSRRLYRGRVDVPKNGKSKMIALPPPARDVLLKQPTRGGELVFVSKTGSRLAASTVCGYWKLVTARAGIEMPVYLATKHLAVHNLFRLGLSRRAIAAQMGWSERAVDSLLATYGHAELVALSEIDALYASDVDRDVEAANAPWE